MNVVHVITTIERGGAENQLAILAKLQVDAGKVVTVVSLKGEQDLKPILKEYGVNLVCLSSKSFIEQVIAIRKALRSADLVHSHLPRAELVVRIASIGIEIKWVVSRHNSERFWPKAPKLISIILSRFVVSKANSVICISNEVARFLVATKEIGKNSLDKLEVILYARGDVAKDIKVNRKSKEFSFQLGIAARLEKQKDFPTLLNALAYLTEKSSKNWTLKIAGSGSLSLKLKKLSTDLKIDSRIYWMGKIEAIEKFYDDIDIFILSSTYEGFGLVLLEAISHEIPIISSDIATSKEILGEDYPGMFPVGDSIQLASIILKMEDPMFRQKCVNTYEVNQSRFDGKAVEKLISRVYETCM